MGLFSRGAQLSQAVAMALETLEERRLLSTATLEPISNVSVPAGRSLILPLRATDSAGNALSYNFSSTNPSFTVVQHTGNPYLELNIAGYGKMDFQLLADVAPRTVSMIKGLVAARFYDGKTFDWIGTTSGPDGTNYTMIQGGNANHSISDTPPFYFDDEFNSDAIFTGDGQLATYKNIISFDSGSFITQDTNGTGFFITKGAARSLDFSSPIFGQLVRGFDVRDAIQAASTDSTGKPNSTITITSARIIEDTHDAVVTIKSAAAGSGDITVSVDDGHGGTDQKTFHVTSAADTADDKPWLEIGNLQDVTVDPGGTVNFPLTAHSFGSNPSLLMGVFPPTAGTASTNGTTLSFTANANYSGPVRLFLEAKPSPSGPIFDGQNIYAWVGVSPITNVQATGFAADAGTQRSGTVATFHDTNPAGSAGDFVAQIIWGDGTVSAGSVTGSNGDYSVTGSHTYSFNGAYPLKVYIGRNPDSGSDVHNMATMARPEATVTVGTLTVRAGADTTINEGATFSGTGSFSAVTGSTFTATVDYGDGDGAQPLDLSQSKTFSLSHAYADSGLYHVTITVTNDLNDSATDTRDITVKNLAPAATVRGGAASVPGQGTTITLSATDPSSTDTSTGFIYVINWGDSKANQTTARGVSSASHTYAAPGTYTVTVLAKDKDKGVSSKATRKVIVRAAQLAKDPWDPAKKALFVGGTKAADKLKLLPATKGSVKVTLGTKLLGTFKPTGRIIVYGGAGNDSILIDKRIKTAVELHGDAGNDILTAGSGNDLIFGGDGNDALNGGAGRDMLIGGVGGDKLNGSSADDILIPSTTQFDADPNSLKLLLAEWVRQDEDYATRVSNITGATQAGSNGTLFLDAATIQSDTSADLLTGSTGSDLFFLGAAGKADRATDKADTETSLTLS